MGVFKRKPKFYEFTADNYTIGVTTLNADQSASTRLLNENGFEPLTDKQALTLIDGYLKEALKGKWFRVEGTSTHDIGLHNWDQNGNRIAHNAADPEKTAFFDAGPHPFSFIVNSDDSTFRAGWRFMLLASVEPSAVAPVVVGIKPKEGNSKAVEETMPFNEPVQKNTYSVITTLASSLESSEQFRSASLHRLASHLAFDMADFEMARDHSLKALSLFEAEIGSSEEHRLVMTRMAAMAARDAGEAAKSRQLLRLFSRELKESFIQRGDLSGAERTIYQNIVDLESRTDGVQPRNQLERNAVEMYSKDDLKRLYEIGSAILSFYGLKEAADEIKSQIGGTGIWNENLRA